MARKYSRELLEPLVAEATSVAEVLRLLGLRLNGGAHAHISRTIKHYGIDTSHFRTTPVMTGRRLRSTEELLVQHPEGSPRVRAPALRKALIAIDRPYQCASCGNRGEWQGAPLRLQVDHIDGDFLNNRPGNLRFLCPNCHRLTPNFAGNSKGRFSRDHTAGDRPTASA